METTLDRTKLGAGHYRFTAKATRGEPGSLERQHNSVSANVRRTDDGWSIQGAGYNGLTVERLRDAEAMLAIDLTQDARRGL